MQLFLELISLLSGVFRLFACLLRHWESLFTQFIRQSSKRILIHVRMTLSFCLPNMICRLLLPLIITFFLLLINLHLILLLCRSTHCYIILFLLYFVSLFYFTRIKIFQIVYFIFSIVLLLSLKLIMDLTHRTFVLHLKFIYLFNRSCNLHLRLIDQFMRNFVILVV